MNDRIAIISRQLKHTTFERGTRSYSKNIVFISVHNEIVFLYLTKSFESSSSSETKNVVTSVYTD